MSFDRPDIYSARVLPGEENPENANTEIVKAFRTFILEYREGSQFIYREQLRENLLVNEYSLTVQSDHLIRYNEELNQRLADDPVEMIPLFEKAITESAQRIIYLQSEIPSHFPSCQLILRSKDNEVSIRELDSNNISKIVRISGIIISASVLSSKATMVQLVCGNCKHTMRVQVNSAFGSLILPSNCEAPVQPGGQKTNCPPDPYRIVHNKSTYIDHQILKLQESHDMVPVGEMPRHIMLSSDRYLTNKVVPGNRVTITGIYSIYQSKNKKNSSSVAIRNPYVRVLGIEADVDHSSLGNPHFSEEEEEEFLKMSRNPNIYESFANSIAPSIYGNDDIKKAIACLLMGGSRKQLPDGLKLRGDINVLLLGDPGTAKSQLLKFVEKVAPISIYTSGKGSSAAGLTASVQRDPMTREFYLEGGAMVLADGGVVCIDEFDKMRDEDRVAIHEAMEQQTISIAKAGITTILNSRTSVLAAANPIYGRYDDMKSPGENIDFQTTILSRFDMIFIVKDDHNEKRDIEIASHVMNIHTGRNNLQQQINGDYDINKMKRYILYCKSKCAPRLTPEASEKLSSYFVEIRKQVHISEEQRNERSSIPITVRQLEAIVRITEALAKLRLSPVATEEHVDEAIRLFRASTMNAVNEGNGMRADLVREVKLIEDELRRRLPIGWSTSYQTLKREFIDGKNYSSEGLDHALYVLEKHDTIQFRSQGKNIFRSGA
ncbi:MCM DNA helicase complex subunit [Saccharomycopsis crataegensis]|uniref:DNA replication licensing factor MCM5 n=1 Tax=Saccharomycopsis crataegensis TaxID=43959 RepID=A0AAV5QL21_9ASCO|nr:MCM DNA helicase complex subunit [Saccharomycopsis crataegensis]